MTIPQDFKEFFQFLNLNKVRYVVVGGYAVTFYGYPRTTGDIDIWIDATLGNAMKIIKSLNQFGMVDKSLDESFFLGKNNVFKIGVPPLRIELITSISGVKFEECYKKRKTVKIDDVTIGFISLDDLKKNKKESGRHKDLNDLENLP
jgi:hypothetical protein